jgi:hypothetical protein
VRVPDNQNKDEVRVYEGHGCNLLTGRRGYVWCGQMADSTPKRLILGTLFVHRTRARKSLKIRILRIWIVFDTLGAMRSSRKTKKNSLKLIFPAFVDVRCL